MSNFNLKEKIHATPLSPNRYLLLLVIILDWFLTMALGLSVAFSRNIRVFGDAFILYSSLSFVVMSSLVGLDYRNRERWIQDRILFEIPFEPSTPSWLKHIKGLDGLVWLTPILTAYLPFLAISLWLIFFMPEHDPMINLVMIVLVVPATIFYRTKKRVFDQRFTIQLADIGMIYNDHLVLWSDSITSPWIDTLMMRDEDPENCILEFDMARNRPNEKSKTYRIHLPQMSSTQRQDLVNKILECNELNRAKNRNGRRFF
jgi:hypothetical protein